MKSDLKSRWSGKKWKYLSFALGCGALLAQPLMAADPKPGTATADTSKQEASKPDAPKPEASKPEAPKPDAAKAEAPKPDALYREGLEAIKINDLVASIAYFRGAAIAGHVPAMVKLAEALDRSGENQEALQWYEKAAKAENPEGALGLGEMLISGGYGKERIKEGVTWIRKAADQRHGAAMVVLSGVISSDRFVDTPDPKEGLKLLVDAADMGYLPAFKELIKVYSFGTLGQKPDPNKVRSLEEKIQKAIKSGGAKP